MGFHFSQKQREEEVGYFVTDSKHCSFAELSCDLTRIQQSFMNKNPQKKDFGHINTKTNCVIFVSSLADLCKLDT